MRHSLMPLTDDRQHINMRGRRYTAPPLTSTCSVVCQSYKEDNNRRKEAKKTKVAEEPRFHNRIGVFRRKTGYKYENHTSFSDEEYQKIIEANTDIIVIHNHPSGSRPSARDIITYAMADIVVLSVVVGHNGDVYAIFDAKKKVEEVYHSLLKEQKKRFYDNDMAVSFAINALYEINSRLGKKQKLFDVRRL